MNKETYNGWSNHATWRVNLEIMDSYTMDEEDHFKDLHELSEWIKEYVEEAVLGGESDEPSLMASYASAFLDDVNYYEIAESVAENYPHIIKTLPDEVSK